MERRQFIIGLGGSLLAVGPSAAQTGARPVVGFLHAQAPGPFVHLVAAFLEGLGERGFIDGYNVEIAYRWAEGDWDRLPVLAAGLVEAEVAVILAVGGDPTVFAAKEATTTIPIVFISGAIDPVALGLVASINRPGGNLTGVSLLAPALDEKRLALLHELLPDVQTVAVLTDVQGIAHLGAPAQAMGIDLRILSAGTAAEIDGAFATIVAEGIPALFVGPEPLYLAQREQIVALAALHRIPAVYASREFTIAGGLMNYSGAGLPAAYRQAGVYTARVLNGESPAELPLIQSDTFIFAINLPVARALGIDIPPSLLALATEFVE